MGARKDANGNSEYGEAINAIIDENDNYFTEKMKEFKHK